MQSSDIGDGTHRSAVDDEWMRRCPVCQPCRGRPRSLELPATRPSSMDHPDVLGRPPVLDAETRGRGCLAALAASWHGPYYSALADAAIDGSATVAEIVDVLVEIIPVVGLPRAVAEAPKLALAVGYDTEEAFEARSGP